MNDIIFHKIYEKIKKAQKVLLVTHDRPDGDALASVGAMAEMLEYLKITYTIFCQSPIPEPYLFIPHADQIITAKTNFDFFVFDLIIVLDCGGLNRTKLVDEVNNKKDYQTIIEMDHHPLMDSYAQIQIKDTKASATCEIVYDFMTANRIKINKAAATCILTGILTDTANFLYPSTTQHTIDIASEMMEYGARYPHIVDWTWRNKSLSAMKLWGQALSNLQINSKYNFAYTILTKEELESASVNDAELEGVAGFLSNLYGVRGVVLLRQEGENKIKGSLRSSDQGADMSRLAQILGGGGHPRASGFVMEGKLINKNGRWEII